MKFKLQLAALMLVVSGVYLIGQSYVPAVPAAVPVTGIGTQVAVGDARQVNISIPVGPVTLFTTGAQTAQYLVAATAYCRVATAGAVIGLSVSSTDPSGTVQTVSSNGACTTLGTTSFGTLRATIAAKNATAITYSVTDPGAAPYDVRVEIYQLSLN